MGGKAAPFPAYSFGDPGSLARLGHADVPRPILATTSSRPLNSRPN